MKGNSVYLAWFFLSFPCKVSALQTSVRQSVMGLGLFLGSLDVNEIMKLKKKTQMHAYLLRMHIYML
jgi:hypothetical protein